ncbi:MAG: ATP-binding protein [Pseudomonadota bacterium]
MTDPGKGLARFPLSAKVNLAVLISTGMALSIAAAVHISIAILEFRPRLEEENRKLAQVVAANISAAVAFDDIEAMNENLQAFELIPEVRGALVRGPNDGILAKYGSSKLQIGDVSRIEDAPGTFWIVTPIQVQGDQIGTLELLIGLDALRGTIWNFVVIALLALLISLLPAFATIRYFKPIILQPVNELRRTMDQVTETRDYAARVQKTVNDEFGELVDRFNAMIDEIQRRDISLAAAAEDMAAARDYAEAANLTKTKFIANMSHELRTPLNAIIGYTEMVIEDLEGDEYETQISDLNRILVAAHHLLGLINDVLDVAKIEAGKLEIHPVPTHLPGLIDEAMEAVRPMALQSDSDLITRVAPEIGSANVDPTRFKQCLLNLLSNACKFTKGGQVTVSAYLATRQGERRIVIEVCDTGVGIDEAHCKQLFEPFVQIDSSMTRNHGGSGLGLAITRDLLAAMGGEISVESTLGEGSCFTILLPAAEDPARLSQRPAPQASGRPEGRAVILAIEDSQDSAMLLRRWLEPAGFDVVIAENGKKGLDLARSLPADFIILDIELPDMSGWRVLEDLRKGGELVHCGIVVLTVQEDRGRALASGASDLLTKPVQKPVLLELVEAHVRATPSEVIILSSDGRSEEVAALIRSAGHRLTVSPVGTDATLPTPLEGGRVIVVDGAGLADPQALQPLLAEVEKHGCSLIFWRPQDPVLAEAQSRSARTLSVAHCPADLLIGIHQTSESEPA